MSSIKLVIFDLDGVLIDTKRIHFDALNRALGPDYAITWDDHLAHYDGLKTHDKLARLTETHGLPRESHQTIWADKQRYTQHAYQALTPAPHITECIHRLKHEGLAIAVCTNSIAASALLALRQLGIADDCECVITNELVRHAKPYPYVFWEAMRQCDMLPDETLIIEDSPVGLLAAARSGACVARVASPAEVTYDRISAFIHTACPAQPVLWSDDRLNVLIPMAGAGRRFDEAGYTLPKPLIDVRGRPMIQRVVESLRVRANYIYVVQRAHRERYHLDTLLRMITPDCQIVETDGVTEGAACTALLAKAHINTDAPLLFANSDQFVEWNPADFLYKMQQTDADGGIVTFTATDAKWSFARIDAATNRIVEVAEKSPISTDATVGYYYWKHGREFVTYAERMIAHNIRVNNEFYVCPVFNEAIADGKHIRPFAASRMWGLGTPDDLTQFLTSYHGPLL